MRIRLVAVGVAVGILIGFTTAWVAYDLGRPDSGTTITIPVQPARSAPPEDRKTFTLTEIADLVSDFDRNMALYTHIADADFTRLLELLDEADALSESAHRYGACDLPADGNARPGDDRRSRARQKLSDLLAK